MWHSLPPCSSAKVSFLSSIRCKNKLRRYTWLYTQNKTSYYEINNLWLQEFEICYCKCTRTMAICFSLLGSYLFNIIYCETVSFGCGCKDSLKSFLKLYKCFLENRKIQNVVVYSKRHNTRLPSIIWITATRCKKFNVKNRLGFTFMRQKAFHKLEYLKHIKCIPLSCNSDCCLVTSEWAIS